MTLFADDFNHALQIVGTTHTKKTKLIHLMKIRYGLDGDGGATLEDIGQRPDVQLTRERVRQVVRQGRELLDDDFLKKTQLEMDSLLKAKGWVALDEVTAVPYFSNLTHPESLSYWLDDVGYRRWQHQGTLYFYNPDLELSDIQSKIRNERKHIRRSKSDARRATLVSSAIKMPEEAHLTYWKRRHNQGDALMSLYTKAIKHALENPQTLHAPPLVESRRDDVQVGLRLSKELMMQIKKISKQKKWGTTLFIRQALLAYLPELRKNNTAS